MIFSDVSVAECTKAGAITLGSSTSRIFIDEIQPIDPGSNDGCHIRKPNGDIVNASQDDGCCEIKNAVLLQICGDDCDCTGTCTLDKDGDGIPDTIPGDGCEPLNIQDETGNRMCDGRDNDCDGLVDDGRMCSCGVRKTSTGDWVNIKKGEWVGCGARIGDCTRGYKQCIVEPGEVITPDSDQITAIGGDSIPSTSPYLAASGGYVFTKCVYAAAPPVGTGALTGLGGLPHEPGTYAGLLPGQTFYPMPSIAQPGALGGYRYDYQPVWVEKCNTGDGKDNFDSPAISGRDAVGAPDGYIDGDENCNGLVDEGVDLNFDNDYTDQGEYECSDRFKNDCENTFIPGAINGTWIGTWASQTTDLGDLKLGEYGGCCGNKQSLQFFTRYPMEAVSVDIPYTGCWASRPIPEDETAKRNIVDKTLWSGSAGISFSAEYQGRDDVLVLYKVG